MRPSIKGLDVLQYPQELTNKAWQAAKGRVGKLAGKTGLGEALDAAHKGWDAINWDIFDASQIRPGYGMKEINDTITAAKSEGSKAQKVSLALYKARDVAKATAEKFKKNPLLKDQVKAATKIATDAEFLGLAIKGMSMKDFDDKKAEFLKLVELAKKNSGSAKKAMDDAIAKLKGDLTLKNWDDHMKQACRSICNVVKAVPELKEHYWDTWKTKDGFQASKATKTGAADEKAVIAGLFKDVVTAYAQVKPHMP